MDKKKQTKVKIISGLIVFLFIISIFSPALVTQAASNSMSNLYNNPNQSGNSAYKFKIGDVVNSGMLTSVVGCTGVVNKVSTWMTSFIQSRAQQEAKKLERNKKMKEQLKSACSSTKASAQAGGNSIPLIGGLSDSIETMFSNLKLKAGGTKEEIKACQAQVEETNDDVLEELEKQSQQEYEANLRTQCLDGIAITLAKNQLTAMTRSAMNWVNSGYGGNPFFVRSMTNLTNNIERNVIETGTDILLDEAFGNPYAYDFAQTNIKNYRSRNGIVSGSLNFLGSLQSDLSAFISDPRSYYTNNQLDQAQNTRSALQREKSASNAFARDFSTGGWNAWLALTQKDQNNPLGFSMLASNYLEDAKVTSIQQTRDELAQNNGFLSQKKCVKWQQYGEDRKPLKKTEGSFGNNTPIYVYNSNKVTDYDVCVDWEIITPGSIIKEKTTNYLNSPERQLELAKTINDSLNALFSALINKLEIGGLSGLSDSKFTDSSINWTDELNTYTSPDGNTTYDNNGAYDGFNLTKDLGNTYIYDKPIYLGTWNASNNTAQLDATKNYIYLFKKEADGKIKLYPDTSPEVYQVAIGEQQGDTLLSNGLYGNRVNVKNGYYIVSKEGNTKLITDGYNGWALGDRAFWDGSKWQNWKNGQKNPIKERGVIQIQQDYITVAKDILKILPGIMPKLGELDYCIPGPNPSYKTNSTNAQSAFQDWIGSMYVGLIDTSGQRFGVNIDKPGSMTYENMRSIYSDNLNVWGKIEDAKGTTTVKLPGIGTISSTTKGAIGIQRLIYTFSNICSGGDCVGNYFYSGDGQPNSTQNNRLNEKKQIMDETSDYVNNSLFEDFYNIFDRVMDKLYFKNMTSKYLESENTTELKNNPAYIEMAESGLALTRDIVSYDEDISQSTKDYTDSIAQAKINISKLDPIKEEVSQIIKAAQDRRNKILAEKLGKTQAEIEKKYATCISEENLSFYDTDDMTADTSVEKERCNDNIDNDLDGLIDKIDPDCKNSDSPTIKISADDVLITKNTGSTTLRWSSNNTKQCIIKYDDKSVTEKEEGTMTISNLRKDTEYRITCYEQETQTNESTGFWDKLKRVVKIISGDSNRSVTDSITIGVREETPAEKEVRESLNNISN